MNRWLHYLRVFFPSWEFFGNPGVEFILEYQINNEKWNRAVPLIERSWGNFFLNSMGSIHHAIHNLVQVFYSRAVFLKNDEILRLSEYKIIKNYISYILNEKEFSNFRFRIVAQKTNFEEEVVFISREEPYEGCL